MSVVLSGDVVRNLGDKLPCPYIRRVSVVDDGLQVHLSIYLLNPANDYDEMKSIIDAFSSKINLYIYVTVQPTRFKDVTLGKTIVLDYLQDQDYSTTHEIDDAELISVDLGDGYITIENIFSGFIDEDGNYLFPALADQDGTTSGGTPVWEFRTTVDVPFADSESDDLLSRQSLQGLWQNYYYKLVNDYNSLTEDEQTAIGQEGTDNDWPNGVSRDNQDYYTWSNWDAGVYVGAFCTAIDLQDQDQVDTALSNRSLLATRIGDVSYETVAENIDYVRDGNWSPSLLNMSLPSQKQIEFMKTDDTIYNKVPMKSLSLLYYEDGAINRKQILDAFSSLIRPESGNYQLDNLTNQITYTLEAYADSPELLVQLNLLRDLFPSKSTTTKVGKLYHELRKMIYQINSTVKQGSVLSKKVIRNLKVVDERTKEAEEYSAPSAAVNAAALESIGHEYIYPNWYQSIEYDDNQEIYTGYGYYFFDYQKALYTTSAIAQVYDMEKLTTLFGIDIPYSMFHLTESSIFRCPELPCTEAADGWIKISAYMFLSTDNNPSYPRVDEIYASNESSTYKNLTFPYAEDISVAGVAGAGSDYGFAATAQLPMLVNRAWSVLDPGDDPSAGTTYSLPSNYRLMCFEYQDFFREFPSEDAKYYGANIVVADSTKQIVTTLDKTLNDSLGDLEDYITAANSLCSYNTSTEEFNTFFETSVLQMYAESANTAPWNTAPVIYCLYRDLYYDAYDGDKDKIMEEAAIIIDQIHPSTGTLSALLSFYEKFQSLYNTLNESITSILEAHSREQEIEFTLPVGSGTLWPSVWTTSEDYCFSDDDCASGEKCQSDGSCMEEAEEEDRECTTSEDCDEGYYCNDRTYKCSLSSEEDEEETVKCNTDSDCDKEMVCNRDGMCVMDVDIR